MAYYFEGTELSNIGTFDVQEFTYFITQFTIKWNYFLYEKKFVDCTLAVCSKCKIDLFLLTRTIHDLLN